MPRVNIKPVRKNGKLVAEISSVMTPEENETFEKDMTSTLEKMVAKSVNGIGKAIPSMSKEDRVEIVRRLEEQGFFLIKGAIKVLAGKLNMSKFTIYNYLDHVRVKIQKWLIIRYRFLRFLKRNAIDVNLRPRFLCREAFSATK